MFDILQTVVFVALIGSFGFYLYLAGKYKGFLEAIRVYLECNDDEPKSMIIVDLLDILIVSLALVLSFIILIQYIIYKVKRK